MESATVTAKKAPPEIAAGAAGDAEARPGRGRRRRAILSSPLTRRVLAVNLLAPVILVVGLLYLDSYRQALFDAEFASLRTRAEMFAAAIGEGAVVERGVSYMVMSEHPARQMVRRLATPAGVRARLFGRDGELVADSRLLLGNASLIQVEALPAPANGLVGQVIRPIYDFVTYWLPSDDHLPPYVEKTAQSAGDYPEVGEALGGGTGQGLRANPLGGAVLSLAVPVQRYKQIVGAVLVSAGDQNVAARLFEVRLAILKMFALAMLVTVGLSLYLAGTIARPVRRLAAAAERVRRGHGRRHLIPDFRRRGDEIGELSGALMEMTEALWRRMDAIEAFAADVSHEIKNPLTSLRSAVETAARLKDPRQQAKLMAIIQDDVARLDRLISDISDASRLDAELSRAETQPVALRPMLEGLAEAYGETGAAGGITLAVAVDPGDDLTVPGLEGRLGQVFRNLIANALSFSPPQGTIRLDARRAGDRVVAVIEDDGPGIPENKLEAIFERFYSERPKSEKFGTHSGLGLSISRQIAEAHGGTITAENIHRPDGTIAGARFTVSLPAV